MLLREQSRWRLPEIDDLSLHRHPDLVVSDTVQVDQVVVGQVEESIESLLGFLATLLVPEDQINPFRQS
jgi:hypothetical protein